MAVGETLMGWRRGVALRGSQGQQLFLPDRRGDDGRGSFKRPSNSIVWGWLLRFSNPIASGSTPCELAGQGRLLLES